MDTKQLNDALAKLFVEERERIVFWHDPEREFIDFMNRLPFLTFGNTTVHIIRLDQIGGLEAKIRLEREDPKGQFLLYSPTMEFWIPRAANRFHFMGSKHFVHGGAMLQEIVVPVITVRHKKDKAIRGETKTKPVTVHVLGTSHKITTPRHRFALLQMEPVSERIKPITLKVAVYESDELVTNIETVTFDSASGNMDERKQWVPLVLRDRQYDKKRRYRLVLRDAETGIEQSSVDVIIDRAFDDDF